MRWMLTKWEASSENHINNAGNAHDHDGKNRPIRPASLWRSASGCCSIDDGEAPREVLDQRQLFREPTPGWYDAKMIPKTPGRLSDD
jgi:hypothetical protein